MTGNHFKERRADREDMVELARDATKAARAARAITPGSGASLDIVSAIYYVGAVLADHLEGLIRVTRDRE